MLINRNNMDIYFPSDRRINIPRKEVLFTFFIHGAAVFLGNMLFFNVFTIIGIWILVLELFQALTLIRRIWLKMGYSHLLYWILWAVYFIISALGAEYLREGIKNLF